MYVTSREEIGTRSQLLLSSANYTPTLHIFMSCLVCLIKIVNLVGEEENLSLALFYQPVEHVPISPSVANKYLLSEKGIRFHRKDMGRKCGWLDSWPPLKMWISQFTSLLIFLSNKMKVPTFLPQAVV